MNLDDESYLSAYLDDELDPADRLAAEWSVEASPSLADQLRSIALARDAVAGLDRPAIPRDLAPALGALIASNRQRAQLRSSGRPARIALVLSGFTGFTAIAASLIFALIRLHPSLHETSDRTIVVAQTEQAPAPRTLPIDPSDSNPLPAPPIASLVQHTTDLASNSKVDPPTATLVAFAPLGEVAERDDRRVIGGILARSHVRRIVIVTDVIDASEQVRKLIAQEARETPEFGRISIRQEIIIDPDHAEAAEVFAVPIDERGLGSFVDRLQKDFPGLIEEGRSSPELVTQLSEVGQVAVFRGLEAAPLGDPPRDLNSFIANRETARTPFILEGDRGPLGPARSEKPVQGSGPVTAPRREMTVAVGDASSKPASLGPDFVGPPDIHRKAPPGPGERVTLLVWVTRPGRR